MWVIREPLPEERRFIVDSWLESFRLSDFAGTFPMSDYRRVYFPALVELLERPRVTARVATVEGVPDLVVGYAVAEAGRPEPCLHYVYTKGEYRRQGCAAALLPTVGIDVGRPWVYTHRTAMSSSLARAATFRAARWWPAYARFRRAQGESSDGDRGAQR